MNQFDLFESKETPLETTAGHNLINNTYSKIMSKNTISVSAISFQEFQDCGSVEKKKAERLTRPLTRICYPSNFDQSLAKPTNKYNPFVQDFAMNHGYIKLSREAEELLLSNPIAFAILSYVAIKAKRIETRFNGHLDFNEMEFCSSTWENLGKGKSLTRQNVRTFLNFLTTHNFLTTRSTANKTYVKLTPKSLYDINPEYNQPLNQPPINHQSTTNQPLTPVHHNNIRSKEECISNDIHIVANAPLRVQSSKKKKEKKEPLTPEKKLELGYLKFEDSVYLLPSEHSKLIEKHGDIKTKQLIEILDSYKVRTGKEYDSDYGALKTGSFVHQIWSDQYEKKNSKKPNLTNKEFVCQHFSNRGIYNGATCYIDENSIAFERGMNHRYVKFNEKGFKDQLDNVLRGFGIPFPSENKEVVNG